MANSNRRVISLNTDEVYRRHVEAGWNIAEFARRCAVTRSHMSEIERGTANPSPALLATMAKVLKCKPAQLTDKTATP